MKEADRGAKNRRKTEKEAGREMKESNARLLIVADDLTGALDTGVQFAGRGIPAEVVTDPDNEKEWTKTRAKVLTVAAATRHLPPEEAYQTVYRTVLAGRRAGIPFVYKKTDSALRGNIGAELSAVMDACEAEMLPFLPAFPAMHRTTEGGRHYIEGVPVSESVFGKDPKNPVTESEIRKLILSQAAVPVRNTSPEKVCAGRGIQVVDAKSDADLLRAGKRLIDCGGLRVSAGCAGFAAHLPALLGLQGRTRTVPEVPFSDGLTGLTDLTGFTGLAGSTGFAGFTGLADFTGLAGLTVICGSLNPITLRQLDYAGERGFARVRLRPAHRAWHDMPDGGGPEEKWLIVDSTEGDCRSVESLAEIFAGLEKTRKGTFLITGGDTLLACLSKLECRRIEPLRELFPGVVLSKCRLRSKERLIISKSGGFGTETLLTDLRGLLEEAD